MHIFRHLSTEQINKLVQSFVLQRYRKGAHVIKQGEVGSSFFVIASGEVNVEISGKFIRTSTKASSSDSLHVLLIVLDLLLLATILLIYCFSSYYSFYCYYSSSFFFFLLSSFFFFFSGP